MKYIFQLCFVSSVIFSCRSSKSLSQYINEPDPYTYQNRHILFVKDSTFTYTLVNLDTKKSYSYNYELPSSLLIKHRQSGGVEFYSLINEKGEVIGIDLLYATLGSKNKRKITYVYNKEKKFDSDSVYTVKLKNYIKQEVSKIKPIINKIPTGIHPTFCSFNFVTD